MALHAMYTASQDTNTLFSHDDVIKWKHFRFTGHLCGEFTGQRWIPRTNASDVEFYVFFDLRQNKQLSKQSLGWWRYRAHYYHCNEFYGGEVPNNVYIWQRIFSSVLWQSNGSGIWQYNHGNPHNAMPCLMHLLMGCTPTKHCFKTATSRQSISPIAGKGIPPAIARYCHDRMWN